MAQVADRRLPVQVLDFFSGCGGMSFGFASATTKRLRFEIRGALDIDPHANSTYRRMLGITPICADARSFGSPKALRASANYWGLNPSYPLLIIGCAPCQGFSSHRKKDRRQDSRNSLLETFGKIASHLRPDVLVMENVPEMLQDRHWDHFGAWRRLMARAGYNIRVRIYNLASFGVPQERFRALVIAAKDWGHFRMPRPTHSPQDFPTVRDAIGHLPPLKAGGVDPHDPMHLTSRHRSETVALIRMIPRDGGSRRSLPKGIGPRCLRNVDGFRDVYGRLAWDKPSVAITARCRTPSCGRYVHPTQHRGLSVREAALLQGFPENYLFDGPFDDRFKQIGNAVSPIFSRAIAKYLDEEWFDDHKTLLPESEVEGDIVSPIAKSFSSSIAAIKRRMRESPERLDEVYRMAAQ
jgi:DNA (cytosine-5)-methyltransferase 1